MTVPGLSMTKATAVAIVTAMVSGGAGSYAYTELAGHPKEDDKRFEKMEADSRALWTDLRRIDRDGPTAPSARAMQEIDKVRARMEQLDEHGTRAVQAQGYRLDGLMTGLAQLAGRVDTLCNKVDALALKVERLDEALRRQAGGAAKTAWMEVR